MITPEEFARWREIEQKTTSVEEWSIEDPHDACCGSWCAPWNDGCSEDHATGTFMLYGPTVDLECGESRFKKEDAEFIIHAKATYLRLLDECDRLRRVIAKELTENDELGSEFTYVNSLREENKRLREAIMGEEIS